MKKSNQDLTLEQQYSRLNPTERAAVAQIRADYYRTDALAADIKQRVQAMDKRLAFAERMPSLADDPDFMASLAREMAGQTGRTLAECQRVAARYLDLDARDSLSPNDRDAAERAMVSLGERRA